MSSPAATLTFVLAETVFAVLPVLRFGLPDGVLARFALVLAPLFWFLGMRYRRHGVLLVATPVAWFVGMTPHLTAVSSLSELLLAMMALLSYLVVHCHQSGERSVYGAHARDEPRAVTTTWAPMAPVFSGEGTAGLYPVVLVLVSFALSPIYAMDWLLTGDAYRVWQTQLARVQSAIILVFALQSAFILEQLLKRRIPLAMSAVRAEGKCIATARDHSQRTCMADQTTQGGHSTRQTRSPGASMMAAHLRETSQKASTRISCCPPHSEQRKHEDSSPITCHRRVQSDGG